MKSKIVILEDNDEISYVLTETISMSIDDYDIVSFKDGDEAWKYISTTNDEIKVVILDHMVPGMKGLEICAKMNNSNKLIKIPVIVQSGKVDLDNETQATKVGAAVYKTKPYATKDLINDIKVLIG